jgi:hypothetical protein
MMAAAHIDDLDAAFDDHPSLSASLEDFEEQNNRSPLFDLPSQHSGFKSEPEASDADVESSNGEPWSPPGFKRHSRGGSGWFRHDPYDTKGRLDLRPSVSPPRSRQTSPEYQDALEPEDDYTLPANVPLPAGTDSPIKERSPEPEPIPDAIMRDFDDPEPSAAEYANNCIDPCSLIGKGRG